VVLKQELYFVIRNKKYELMDREYHLSIFKRREHNNCVFKLSFDTVRVDDDDGLRLKD
jgi:hypothetical protein